MTPSGLPHTAWGPGGCKEGARDMTSHTWQLSRQTPGAHKYSAPGGPGNWTLYGGAYYLWVLSAESGSCHSPGTWNFKLAPTFTENLCTLVQPLAKRTAALEVMRDWTDVTGCVSCKCISVAQVAWHVILCVSVNIPSGAHDASIANSTLRILCLLATNVCSGERVTCAANCILTRKAIISNYMQQVPSSKACSFSASL